MSWLRGLHADSHSSLPPPPQMVGKYVSRSIQISASSAMRDSGSGQAGGDADDDGSDALVRLIRREVQRALSAK